jgi:pimeloyl-ACP methyl ester carboxylesterase
MLETLKNKDGEEIIGSLVEKTYIEIGGIKQGFFIRSENPENPIVLFLHGGPGDPELPFIIYFELSERLEKYFTVCYWDQRGSGMSFNSLIGPKTMTVEQMIEDTRQLTEYLQQRFGHKKIYLMGHSWGSYLGIKTIEKYPDYYFAYIGIGQVANDLESEKLAYDYMLKHAMETNDNRAVKKLKKIDKDSSDFPQLKYIMTTRSLLMNKYGIGIMRKNCSTISLLKSLLFFKGYTFSEKINFARGSLFSLKHLFDKTVTDNLFESSITFQVPIFIMHGKWDYQVSYTLAREWFDKIVAPQKMFFSFDNSAHSPNMEEPEKFVQIVRDITLQISREW